MTTKEILKLESGLYTGTDEDGNKVMVFRQEGSGYTIKREQGEGKPLWCVDYDEDGNEECEYPEY